MSALRATSMLVALVPFAFGVVRAVRTGQDLRYLWVALAGLIGAAVTVHLGRTRPSAPVAAAAFVAAGVLALLAARLLGTTLGPGILIVASAFAACFGAAALLFLTARTFQPDPR